MTLSFADRGAAGEGLLDLLGLDVLPARDEEVVLAAPDVQVTVLVQGAEVAGVEPAVVVERAVYRGAFDVAGEERLPSHEYLAPPGDGDLPVRQRTTRGAQ